MKVVKERLIRHPTGRLASLYTVFEDGVCIGGCVVPSSRVRDDPYESN